MNQIKIAILFCLFAAVFQLNAQEIVSTPRVFDKTSVGIGGGLDYGGLGANLLVYSTPTIGLFGGMGYAMAGVGFNAGAKLRFPSQKHFVDPYALVMYGYNAAIAIEDADKYNKLYYGPSVGFGLDFQSRKAKGGYWTVALLLPIRSSAVDNYIDDLEKYHGVDFNNKLSPVTFSFGYRYILK